jgi:hypothetical protein
MIDKDKQEFEKWFIKTYRYDYKDLVIPESINPQKEAWQAALEYERNISEKVFDLFNKNIDVLDDEIYKLQAENKKLREALESIANSKNYPEPDYLIAREALKEVGEA